MTNYEMIVEKANPELLAVLISQDIFFNSCLLCNQRFVPYKYMCDHKCYSHILAWLNEEATENGDIENLLKIIDFYGHSNDAYET